MASVAILFVISALICVAIMQLIAPPFVERIRLRRRCPRGLLHLVAIVELLAAAFLMVPETRIWGILATIGAIAASLDIMHFNRRFVWICIALVALAAIIPVAVAE